MRNITTITTLCVGLLLSTLVACDPDVDSDLELRELELAERELEAEDLEAEDLDSSVYACEPTEAIHIDELELTPQANPARAPEPPPGGGGCGNNWIIYGSWQTTTGCGGCVISGNQPGKKQVKVDTIMNNCGIQYQLVYERCVTC